MKNLKRLKSFSDYKQNIDNSSVNSSTPSVSEGKLHKSVVSKQRMVKESAFKVGDDYKVKVTFDIPVSLISSYIEKVQSETGKNALEHFNETELAEQMAQYILKQHLNIDQIPSALAVGEDVSTPSTDAQADGDAANLNADFGDVPSGDTAPTADDAVEEAPTTAEPTDNIDINDSDLNLDNDGEDIPLDSEEKSEEDGEGEDIPLDSETPETPETAENPAETSEEEPTENQDESEIDLESDEVNLGEEREIEAKSEEEEEEYEEIDLDSEIGSLDIDSDANLTTLSIKSMITYLKFNGIDCSECSNEDIVNIYNEISNDNCVGIDDDGNMVKPTHEG
jgi:hypothetical protein